MTNLQINSDLPYRRRLVSAEGCKADLELELRALFKAFSEAVRNYEQEISATPPQARGRGFEASLMNSKTIQAIQSYFPTEWKFGRYRRFILRVNGYSILFKKLNAKNRPMNIPTKLVQAITHQLALPLDSTDHSVLDPILYFGYQKNRFGVIINSKLVYIDENKVQWILTEEDLDNGGSVIPMLPDTVGPNPLFPRLKSGAAKKKASN